MKMNFNTMKILAITLLALFIAGDVSAGYSWDYNSKSCKWWRKKYKARAHVTFTYEGVPMCFKSDKSCYSANATCSVSGFNGCRATANGWARNQTGGGSISNCPPLFAGEKSDLTRNYFPESHFSKPEFLRTDLVPGKQTTSLKHTWEEGLLTISEMTFDLTSSVEDELINKFEFTFWIPNHIGEVEDTKIDADEILYHASVELYKGKLLIEGDVFTEKDFSVIIKNGVATVKYIGTAIELEIPEEYKDMDKALNFAGDVTINEDVEFEKAIDSENNTLLKDELALEIFPNPTVETLNIGFKTNETENPILSIYNVDGKLIKNFSRNIIRENTSAQIEIKVNDFLPGTYFILLQVGEEKIIEKFIKQ